MMRASSLGFGELIARFQGAPRLWIGLGGSATVDGGRDWPELRLPLKFADGKMHLGPLPLGPAPIFPR